MDTDKTMKNFLTESWPKVQLYAHHTVLLIQKELFSLSPCIILFL